MKWVMDHESIARRSNALDIVELLVDRMDPRHWQFPFSKCVDCETGMIISAERPYADTPGTSCNGCIYSHLDPVETKAKRRRGRP